MHRNTDSNLLASSVSVVMVTYNTGAVLFEAIDCVLSQDLLNELVIIDNGNPHSVLSELKLRSEEDKRVKIYSGHGNIGFAAGCNLGAEMISGSYLMLLNPDCLIPEGALRKFLEEAKSFPRPWMMGCRLIGRDGTEQSGARREALTPWTAIVEVLCLHRIVFIQQKYRRFNLNSMPNPTQTTKIPVTSGACMIMPVDDYRAIGGMDEQYFMHVEDIDFCHRFRKAGGEIYYTADISVIHILSSSDTSPFFIEWQKTIGFIRYFRKNYSDDYPKLFLFLFNLGIIIRFCLKIVKHSIFFILRVLKNKLFHSRRSFPFGK